MAVWERYPCEKALGAAKSSTTKEVRAAAMHKNNQCNAVFLV
jgi:hypothetical protein